MFSDVLNPIVESLEKNLTTRQVFGEPLQVGGVTLVPVMDLMFGFGGGSGEGKNEKNEGGTGGGGGGGARLAPKAIIVISEGHASVMMLGKAGFAEKIAEAIPSLVDRLAAAKGAGKGEAKTEAE